MDEQKITMISEEDTHGAVEEFKHGRVSCERLNVRKTCSAGAEVKEIITRNQMVIIDNNPADEGWYPVITESGIEGYCMCQFIEILD